MTRRGPDLLDDDALDLVIRTTLDVAPAPGFEARLRARIAGEPMSRERNWTRKVVGLAAAAALAALVALVWRPGSGETSRETVARPSEPAPTVSAPARPAAALAVAPESAKTASTTSAAPFTRGRQTPAPDAATASTEPAVLIDHREVMAFRRLLAALDPERIDMRTLERDIPTATEPLPIVAQLSVEPVVVAELN
jgi:hypothetical protein